MPDCAYCGCDVANHDPVCVCTCSDGTDDEIDYRFCNFGCLSAYIEDDELTTGTACEWSPS